jgi:hypothetical protein
VVEDEEQETLKGEQHSDTSSVGRQPSHGEELTPSNSVKRPRWFMKTLRDTQKHVEAPKSIFMESRPPKKFPNFVVLMSNIVDSESSNVQEAVDQQVWTDAMGQDDVWDIVLGREGQSISHGSSRSTFLAKSEC